jgi:hypothetical protein
MGAGMKAAVFLVGAVCIALLLVSFIRVVCISAFYFHPALDTAYAAMDRHDFRAADRAIAEADCYFGHEKRFFWYLPPYPPPCVAQP